MTENDKGTKKWQPLIYAVVLSLGIAGGYFLQNTSSPTASGGSSKIGQVMGLINGSYVDTVDGGKLSEAAIVEMLHNLDPHSNYIPAEELVAANEQLDGNFEGIGVEFNLLDDTIFIVTVLPGGPSEKVGIMQGDRIVRVDGKIVAGIGIENGDVIKKLKGKKNTKVTVGIKRLGVNKELEFTITRDKIPIYSIDAAYMLTPTTGYIKLERFAKDTYSELIDALKKLRKSGMKELVLDLRGNPGGYLQTATGVVSEFLGEGKLMVYTEGRKQKRREYITDGKGSFTSGKLVVLVDEGSASASEIVSGAVQDWDRGLVVGRRSYGKGLVQESFMLNDGSAIRLTIARYYTPTGRCIQKPYDGSYDEYESEINNRFKSGELDHPDSVKKNEKQVYKTPAGRKVYGGGGIYPDIFVPLDTALHTKLVTTVYSNGFISRLAYQYADKNRNSLLARYKTGDDFVAKFSFGNEIINALRALMADSKLPINEAELAITQKLINNQVKAYVARQVYGKETFYKALAATDETLITAQKALNQYEGILSGKSKLVSK